MINERSALKRVAFSDNCFISLLKIRRYKDFPVKYSCLGVRTPKDYSRGLILARNGTLSTKIIGGSLTGEGYKSGYGLGRGREKEREREKLFSHGRWSEKRINGLLETRSETTLPLSGRGCGNATLWFMPSWSRATAVDRSLINQTMPLSPSPTYTYTYTHIEMRIILIQRSIATAIRRLGINHYFSIFSAKEWMISCGY